MVIHNITPDKGDGGDLWNVGFYLNIDTADHLRIFQHVYLLWKLQISYDIMDIIRPGRKTATYTQHWEIPYLLNQQRQPTYEWYRYHHLELYIEALHQTTGHTPV
jgi:hypothetical protein